MNFAPDNVTHVHSPAIGREAVCHRCSGQAHDQRMRLMRRKVRRGLYFWLVLAQLVATTAGALAARGCITHGIIAACIRVRVEPLQGYRQFLLQALLLDSSVGFTAAWQNVPVLLMLLLLLLLLLLLFLFRGIRTRLLRLGLFLLWLILVLPALFVLLFMLHLVLPTMV